MELITTQFTADEQTDEDAANNTDSKTGNIDKRIEFIPLDIPYRNFQITFRHNVSLFCS
jgi:hypothetical protein